MMHVLCFLFDQDHKLGFECVLNLLIFVHRDIDVSISGHAVGIRLKLKKIHVKIETQLNQPTMH